MQDAELRAWLALHRTPQLSSRSLAKILSVCSDPFLIKELSPEVLGQLGITPQQQTLLKRPLSSALKTLIEADFQYIATEEIELIPLVSNDYPAMLKEINDPPPLLYVRGDKALLNRPQIAMVGSRRCSPGAQEVAQTMASDLAAAGFVVTSGLALGIDAASHRGALSADQGKTIAVLGTGIDERYPASNRTLYEVIPGNGAIVSEFVIGTKPHRSLFPQRNRLISGMSLGVVIVEAALKSGSLITARCALEQDREVFAIPGSIRNLSSSGCHQLIQQGAKLVTCANDIMEEFSGWLSEDFNLPDDSLVSVNETAMSMDTKEQQLLQWISFDPAPVDLLQQRCGWDMAELLPALMALEINGWIGQQAGCYVRIK